MPNPRHATILFCGEAGSSESLGQLCFKNSVLFCFFGFFGGGFLLLEGVCAWLPGLPITTHSKQCSCWPSQLSHSDKCHFVNCVKSTVEPAA